MAFTQRERARTGSRRASGKDILVAAGPGFPTSRWPKKSPAGRAALQQSRSGKGRAAVRQAARLASRASVDPQVRSHRTEVACPNRFVRGKWMGRQLPGNARVTHSDECGCDGARWNRSSGKPPPGVDPAKLQQPSTVRCLVRSQGRRPDPEGAPLVPKIQTDFSNPSATQ